jgi:hypothetical protein
MNAMKKFFTITLLYLMVIGTAGLISAYSVQESMAVTVIGNEGLSVDPVDAMVFDIKNMYPGKEVSSEITIRNDGAEPFSLDIRLDVNGGGAELIRSLKITITDQGADPQTDYYYSGMISDMGTRAFGDIPANSSKILDFTLDFLPGEGNATQNQTADMSWTFAAAGTSSGDSDPVNLINFDFPVIPNEEITPPENPLVEPVLLIAEVVPDDVPPAIGPPIEEATILPEAPQVDPLSEQALSILSYWPYLLLLLLIPILLFFMLARQVLVMVPGTKSGYNIVARKFAWRKDKRWYVNIEKQLEKHLAKHGLVVVDFRGGLLKGASKMILAGETMLGASGLRYALIGSHRMVTWVSDLKRQVSSQVG